MTAGKGFSLRWDPDLLAAVDRQAQAHANGNRSRYLAQIATEAVARDEGASALEVFARVEPLLTGFLLSCSPEDRALCKKHLERMADAYNDGRRREKR